VQHQKKSPLTPKTETFTLYDFPTARSSGSDFCALNHKYIKKERGVILHLMWEWLDQPLSKMPRFCLVGKAGLLYQLDSNRQFESPTGFLNAVRIRNWKTTCQ